MTDSMAIDVLVNGLRNMFDSGDLKLESYSELMSFMSGAELISFLEFGNDFKVKFSDGLDMLEFTVSGNSFDWKWG